MARSRVAMLLVLLAASASGGEPEERGSSVHLYVRGAADLAAILDVVRSDVANRTGEDAPLVVLLVDPGPRSARAVAGAGDALVALRSEVGEHGRVLVVTAGADCPDPSGAEQDLAATVKAIAENPLPGVRNLLGEVRRVARSCRSWDGPKDLVLVADVGASVEEDTERTVAALRRSGFRFSVVAGEAAFCQPWRPSPPRPEEFLPRLTGHPDERGDTVYAACETPFPDTPGAFDLDLAPARFHLTPEHVRVSEAFALPSGFGYYHLARLCHVTGGRYFLFGFASGKGGGFDLPYDYGLLRLFEPDLRPRSRIVSEIPGHPLARAVYDVWSRLAEPRVGVIRRRPPLGAGGGRVVVGEESAVCPNRTLKLTFLSRGESVGMTDLLRERLGTVEDARDRLDLARRAYRRLHEDRIRTGDHRWVAQVDLLRLQLLRVAFHLGEILETLAEVRSRDFRNETIALSARPLYRGSTPLPGIHRPVDPDQIRRLDALAAETLRLEETYAGTPWGYAARLGETSTWVVVTRPKGESRPVARSGDDGDADPAPKPKPGPGRPSSAGSGSTTGGD